MKLAFVKAVTEVQIDPVSAAVKLIESERQKVPYNSKEKWLCFDVQATTIDVLEQLVFLKAVRSRLVAKNRKEYGASRNIDTQLVSDENGVPVLYVHSERYMDTLEAIAQIVNQYFEGAIAKDEAFDAIAVIVVREKQFQELQKHVDIQRV